VRVWYDFRGFVCLFGEGGGGKKVGEDGYLSGGVSMVDVCVLVYVCMLRGLRGSVVKGSIVPITRQYRRIWCWGMDF